MKTSSMLLEEEALKKEVFFKMSRSGGNGGQNVNKVATKATLFFNVTTTNLFSETQKLRVLAKLKPRITNDGNLVIQCQSSRSALSNKKEALRKLKDLLEQAVHLQKKRKPSRTPAAVHRKRLEQKKRQSFKKSFRRKVNGSSTIGLF